MAWYWIAAGIVSFIVILFTLFVALIFYSVKKLVNTDIQGKEGKEEF